MIARAAAALLALSACTRDVQVGEPLRRVLDVSPDPPRALDILFVVDPSAAAEPERDQLVAIAGDAVFGELTSRLGTLPDLHVGVITSEMAQYGLPAGCDGSHDGEMLAGTVCPVTGTYLIDTPNADGTRLRNYLGELGDVFSCIATVPSSTCEVAQPIAAVQAALVPDAKAIQDGFLRDYAMLLVVFLEPRDDCSAADSIFYAQGELTEPSLESRCFSAGATCDATGCTARDDGPLVSVADAAAALRRLKPDPTMVMVAGVFMSPVGAQVDVADQGDPVPVACGNAGATPAPRLAALVGQFPTRYGFTSMCDGDAGSQLTSITDSVADVLGGGHCLRGPIALGAPCRAYTEDATGARTFMPACAGEDGGTCFTIAASNACEFSDTALAATPTAAPVGAHFVVECVADDGL